MTLRSSIIAMVSCASSLLLAAGTARAITLPDIGSCATSGTCLRITNNGNGAGITIESGDGVAIGATADTGIAISGTSTSSSGVYGTGLWGVHGNTSGGYAVYGTATTGNGVVGENNVTDWSAAAVSALSGHATNGLAYWGTGSIIVTGDAYKPGGGSWQVYSDARLKKEVTPLRMGLDQIRQIRPVTFKYNGLGNTTDTGREYVGVIAQELEKILPSMVTSRKGKLHPGDTAETDIKIVDPSAFSFLLVNAVKEQQQIIERQERRIAALERGRGLSASIFGGGVETVLAMGLLPLGFVAIRRRKALKTAP